MIRREAVLPDPWRAARYKAYPEIGPRIVFFTGGTALRELSRTLAEYSHNCVHLITPFDSGGSSAVLRKAFGMPAVGDIRNRIMALADRTVRGNPEVGALFAHRFPKDAGEEELRETLADMIRGSHPLVRRAPEPLRSLARYHLRYFFERMPRDFDLRGASVGNLILAGGYFNNERNLEAVIFLFSRLAKARGVARPIVDADLHLAARLEDGSLILGQRRLTGKEVPPIASRVADLWLTAGEDDPAPVDASISPEVAAAIRGADLICYPMGSFYTSLMANLLPGGVAGAIADNRNPRVYLPNLGHDPEEWGMRLGDKIRTLGERLARGLARDRAAGTGAEAGARPDAEAVREARLLDVVLLDAGNPGYGSARDVDEAGREAERLGAQLVFAPLSARNRRDRLDPRLTAEHLLSLI